MPMRTMCGTARVARRAAWWCAMLALVGWSGVASAQPCDFDLSGGRPAFPRIPTCAFAGAYQDSSLLEPASCLGMWMGPLADSVLDRPRTITVRFLRDRVAEARSDFGGYRVYRVFNSPDTTFMVLLRRFSKQRGDERTWNFSSVSVDTTTLAGGARETHLNFRCRGSIVHDSVVTFMDPDSVGNFVKVCRLRRPQEGVDGACLSIGDSVFVLKAPDGPHDGFRTWYAITYEARNSGLDATYEDLFVPDTTGQIGPCDDPLDKTTCPNLNHKALNIVGPVSATGGPLPDPDRVAVVPNPYRAAEAWDQPGGSELHFVNLPPKATIKIYTVAGDLVAELVHDDVVSDFKRWDLKNKDGRDVASGVYIYRVEAGSFDFQNRFVVIR